MERDGTAGWDGMGSETNSIDDDRIGWDNSIMNAYNRTVVINKERFTSKNKLSSKEFREIINLKYNG